MFKIKDVSTLDEALMAIAEQNEILSVANELVKTASWFVYYDEQGNVSSVRWSDEMRQLFGYANREEFPNTMEPFVAGMHPDDRARILDDTRADAYDNDSMMTVGMEFRFLTKHDGYQWFRSMGKLQRDEAGKAVRVLGLIINITQQKEFDELNSQKEAAFEALQREVASMDVVHEMLSSGKWTMDFDESGAMTAVTWSDEFRHMLGYTGVEDFPNVLESWSDLLHPDDKDRVLGEYRDTIADYSGKKMYDVEYQLLTKDRGYRWYRATGKPTRRDDGTPVTYVGMFVDITDQKRKDDQIAEQRKLLEEALARAEAASAAKTTFLFNMSHDIRTPMNAIIGYTNLARKPDTSESAMHDYLEKIASSSHHLLSLINDVLEMSRIESGKMELELAETDLVDAVLEIKDMFEAQMDSKQIEFAIDASDVRDRIVLADGNRLNRLLLNLVSNAYKFTPEGGKVSISLRQTGCAEDGRAPYELRVKDSGIGMSEEFAAKVFDAFERERTSTVSGIQGTGLGMAITKSIVNLMGGTIEVETEQGRGTEFIVCCPFEIAEPADAPENTPLAESDREQELDFSGKRILLVEDNEINREIAVILLEDLEFVVETAVDGKEAVEKVVTSPAGHYDAVLMDVQMPVMNGYEATRAIRALDDEARAHVPIIATTANAFAEDVKAAQEAGMDAHIAKPLDVGQMIDTLETVLARNR